MTQDLQNQDQIPASSMPVTPGISNPTNRKFQNLPVLLGALTILSLAAAGYFFYQNQQLKAQLTSLQPTSQPTTASASPSPSANLTANWKGISSEYWQFKVPTNWNYLKCSPELLFVGPSIAQDSSLECAFDGSPGVVQISRILSSNEPWPYPIATEDSVEPSVSNRTTINVDDKTAIMQIETYHEGQGQGTRWRVYIPHSSDTLDIITLHEAGQKETTFDQILSTFKFLENEEQTTNERADWNVYTDTDVSFQIEYPDGWNLRKTYGQSVSNVGNSRVSGVDISTNLSTGSTVIANVIDPQNTEFFEWVKLYSGKSDVPDQPNSTYKNRPAFRFEYFREGRPPLVETYVEDGNFIVYLANNSSLADLQTADLILSTFKIIH